MDAVLDMTSDADTGIPGGKELLGFVDAVEAGAETLARARAAVVEVVGHDGMLEAAATIAAFNGLIRVADGTGIQLDEGLKAVSAHDRAEQGINAYAGAASTPDTEAGSDEQVQINSVQDLFG